MILYHFLALQYCFATLQQLNFEEDGEHKMLVFAFGVGHARSICEQFNDLAGEKVADWIGVQSSVTKDDGSSVTIGRSEPENERVLKRFKAGDFRLV